MLSCPSLAQALHGAVGQRRLVGNQGRIQKQLDQDMFAVLRKIRMQREEALKRLRELTLGQRVE